MSPTTKIVLLATPFFLRSTIGILTKQVVAEEVSKPEECIGIASSLCERFRTHILHEKVIVFRRKPADLAFMFVSGTPVVLINICFCKTVPIPQAKDETLFQAGLFIGEDQRQCFFPRLSQCNCLTILFS